MISVCFNIFQYFKSLPKLKFKFYNSNYIFPLNLKKKILFEKGVFGMELLVTNFGNKEISVIDIFPPIEQVSQIKVFKDNINKPYYLLKELTKFESQQKEHIPLLNCSRLRIELLFKLRTKGEEQNQEINYIWNKIHNEDILVVTSDNKKYKVNPKNILHKMNKKPFGIFSTDGKKFIISSNIDGRISSSNLGVRFIRRIQK